MIQFKNLGWRVLALAALSTGCALPTESAPENVASQEDDLYVISSKKWPSNEIKVCWEDSGYPFDNYKPWIRDAIQETWEIESAVTFTEWDQCAANDPGIHVGFINGRGVTHYQGKALDGKTRGMELNTWPSGCDLGNQERCMRATAVHEFGHALAWAHEQLRDQSPGNACPADPDDTVYGDVGIGPLDTSSVMYYCNPLRNGDGRLSAGDIRGVIQVYGDNMPITAASWGGPTTDVYFRGAGPGSDQFDLYETYTQNTAGGAWSSPADVGGTFASSPNVVSWGAGHISVFAVGTGYDVWQKTWQSGIGWSGWVPLSGYIKGKVKAVARTTNRLDIFARGGDDALWTRSWNGSAWSGWASLGSDFVGEPSAVATDANHVDVFVRGRNGHLLHKGWNGAWAVGWDDFGDGLASSPSAVVSGTGRIDVGIRDIDDHVWVATVNSGALTGWTYTGATAIRGTPKLISRGTNRVDVFARGTDNNLWLNGISITGDWVGWAYMPASGPFKGSPEAITNGDGRIDLFAVTTSGALKRRAYYSGTYYGFSTIAGTGSVK